MANEVDYVYRGTTRGWPGNPGSQALQMTCTSTDPLVATLFAIQCLRHGDAVVYLAPRDSLNHLVGPRNHFDEVECAVNYRVSPSEFPRYVALELHPHKSRDILIAMGFSAIPYLINDNETLDNALEESRDLSERLNPDQIREFNRRAHAEAS